MANFIPDTPDALLTRDRTAEALTEAGFPVKSKTLATKATRGGGPPFSKFGPRALYRWDDALAWAVDVYPHHAAAHPNKIARKTLLLPLATRPVDRCWRKPVGQISTSLCDLTGCTRARTMTCAKNPRGAEKV